MKIFLSLIALFVALGPQLGRAQAMPSPVVAYTGFDLCYQDMRGRFVGPERSAETCRGVFSTSCYIDARGPFGRIDYAVQTCQGFISNLCYEDVRRFNTIENAARICQMVHLGN